jgi:tripartite-type tricarboxylate transporter receptor subunit TctC
VKRAKEAADPLPYASPGSGTHMHLFAELMADKKAIKLSNIPFRGTAPALSAVISGHVPVGWTWSATENIRAGQVRALAVSTNGRLPDLPDVPTFKELGYPDLTATTWFSISGPAGLPREIVDRLNSEINRIIQMPEVKERLAREAILTSAMSPSEITAFIGSEITRWRPLAKIVTKQSN